MSLGPTEVVVIGGAVVVVLAAITTIYLHRVENPDEPFFPSNIKERIFSKKEAEVPQISVQQHDLETAFESPTGENAGSSLIAHTSAMKSGHESMHLADRLGNAPIRFMLAGAADSDEDKKSPRSIPKDLALKDVTEIPLTPHGTARMDEMMYAAPPPPPPQEDEEEVQGEAQNEEIPLERTETGALLISAGFLKDLRDSSFNKTTGTIPESRIDDSERDQQEADQEREQEEEGGDAGLIARTAVTQDQRAIRGGASANKVQGLQEVAEEMDDDLGAEVVEVRDLEDPESSTTDISTSLRHRAWKSEDSMENEPHHAVLIIPEQMESNDSTVRNLDGDGGSEDDFLAQRAPFPLDTARQQAQENEPDEQDDVDDEMSSLALVTRHSSSAIGTSDMTEIRNRRRTSLSMVLPLLNTPASDPDEVFL